MRSQPVHEIIGVRRRSCIDLLGAHSIPRGLWLSRDATA
jgi:hypothetical protein